MSKFEEYFSSKAVQDTIDTLLTHLNKHKQAIQSVKAANPTFVETYAQQCERLVSAKGAGMFFPYLSSGVGNGALVELGDGSVKYDFISGIGVHFSHSDLDVIKSSLKGALMDTVMQGNLQQNQGSVELYELFKELSGFDHVFLTSTGVMAVENALKLAFHYKQHATRVIAFKGCFSGRTICAASITDKSKYRMGLPLSLNVDYIDFYQSDHPNSISHSLQQLKDLVHRYPGQHAAMIFELVQGEGGFNVGDSDFFKALMSYLQDQDIPIIADEVQTFGHTTECFAFQHFGLEKFVDIVSVGKLSQTCATLYKKSFKPKAGLLSQTFTSSSVAIEASKTILNKLKHDGYFGSTGKNAAYFDYFGNVFKNVLAKHPLVLEGPYGIGAMIAFKVFNGDPDKTLVFLKRLYQNGVVAFVTGSSELKIRFLLPIGGVTYSDIDAVTQLIDKSLTECKQEGMDEH